MTASVLDLSDEALYRLPETISWQDDDMGYTMVLAQPANEPGLWHDHDDALAALYRPMLNRETNRHRATPRPLSELAPDRVPTLHQLREQFRDLTGTQSGETQVSVLRFIHAPTPSVRSRRRPDHELTG